MDVVKKNQQTFMHNQDSCHVLSQLSFETECFKNFTPIKVYEQHYFNAHLHM